MDILINTFASDFPAFTAKDGIRKWPVIGILGQAYGAMYLNRAGSKEQKDFVVK